MADWRTYATAARRTAARQVADGTRRDGSRGRRDERDRDGEAPRNGASRRSPGMGEYARAAGRALDEGTRESRDRARRNAAATYVVAGRRVRRARLGMRLRHAFRDAVLMGLSIAIIWFVVTRTGVQIPPSILAVVILGMMAIRFGYALVARHDTTLEVDNELEGGVDDGPVAAPGRGSIDEAPREQHRAVRGR